MLLLLLVTMIKTLCSIRAYHTLNIIYYLIGIILQDWGIVSSCYMKLLIIFPQLLKQYTFSA